MTFYLEKLTLRQVLPRKMGIITRFEQGNGYNTNFLRTFAVSEATL